MGKTPRPERPTYSDQEIRAKIQAKKGHKVQLSRKAKLKKIKEKSAEDFDKSNFVSDIRDNDPTSKNTQNKLRKIIETGGFQFNENERQVLEDILYDKA